MINQTLFSLKHKSKKLKCHLLQFLFGASRVTVYFRGSNLILCHLSQYRSTLKGKNLLLYEQILSSTSKPHFKELSHTEK